jgi:hypothetical protein
MMLNPSTADAFDDDPTIRKCVGFAKRWGQGGIQVVNLYAYRATDPKELKLAHARGVNVVGPENDQAIVDAMRVRLGGKIVAAWGGKCRTPRRGLMRDRTVLAVARCSRVPNAYKRNPILCLKRSASTGFPWHPLYVSYETIPTPYGEAP